MAELAERLAGKRVFVSSGVDPGTIAIMSECGRVMAVEPIATLTDRLLDLTDTVCLNYDDAQGIPFRREA
ncbi:hypothetical protein ACUN0C_15290 [Faunimonas sp. B44]|uniref:hypothetical protein n=1 Tax=Faunimonas sp. B44 TaxID=3461493 RepID=UPI0040444B14